MSGDRTERERSDQHDRGASEGGGGDTRRDGPAHALPHHARGDRATERGTEELPSEDLERQRDAADDVQGVGF